jgi:hypothetical protein
MVSPNYRKYSRIIRWPDLKVVRQKGSHEKWHIDEPSLSCPAGSRISLLAGERHIFKIWVSQSLDTGKLYMLDHNGNEIRPDEICDICAGQVLRLLKWRSSDEGNLEIEQQELKDKSEERDFRAKGLLE